MSLHQIPRLSGTISASDFIILRNNVVPISRTFPTFARPLGGHSGLTGMRFDAVALVGKFFSQKNF